MFPEAADLFRKKATFADIYLCQVECGSIPVDASGAPAMLQRRLARRQAPSGPFDERTPRRTPSLTTKHRR